MAGVYFSHTSPIYFWRGFSCCLYYPGVCYSGVPASRELPVFTWDQDELRLAWVSLHTFLSMHLHGTSLKMNSTSLTSSRVSKSSLLIWTPSRHAIVSVLGGLSVKRSLTHTNGKTKDWSNDISEHDCRTAEAVFQVRHLVSWVFYNCSLISPLQWGKPRVLYCFNVTILFPISLKRLAENLVIE